METNKTTIEALTREIILVEQELPRTPQATHVGGKDQELHRVDTTKLNGKFDLRVDSGINLIGEIDATIKEDNPDYTEFHLKHAYNLYSAPNGFKILNVKIKDDPTAGFSSTLMATQEHFGDNEVTVISGPLKKYVWVGDTNSNQDHIVGCYVKPYLKSLIVTIEKML